MNRTILLFVVFCLTFTLVGCSKDFGYEAEQCESIFGNFNGSIRCPFQSWVNITHGAVVHEMPKFLKETEKWTKNEDMTEIISRLKKVYKTAKEDTYDHRLHPSFDAEPMEEMTEVLEDLEEECEHGHAGKIPRVREIKKVVEKALWVWDS